MSRLCYKLINVTLFSFFGRDGVPSSVETVKHLSDVLKGADYTAEKKCPTSHSTDEAESSHIGNSEADSGLIKSFPASASESCGKQPTRFSTRIVKRPRRDLSPPESPVKKGCLSVSEKSFYDLF